MLLALSFTLNYWLWDDFKIQLTIIMFASFVVLLIGVLKKFEPSYSYKLTPGQLSFYHRSGKWHIKWQDIVRIGSVKASIQGQLIELAFIGIKLNNIETIAASVSPRLANRLLHEQKELIQLAVSTNEIKPQDAIIKFEPYNLQGKVYKGPIAAWLYRSEQLMKAYGYHLYLPEDSFDRSSNEFKNLLKQCKSYSQGTE
ncbi:DUF2982 domain-containing protein [Thalassomonas sp. M1454]|uniref:DUF2982 domain-containing protein n=1 Tax=Thalassomonas sp. M1454 TaxID=2594477 RepID=UPI00117DB7D4|nr:DUF2982 domain-containing protein [Thalassomonas sp. M1454]TRX56777.1 DUF2982 domain-containing protein [Thalassomonas sp. M1454]